MLMSMRTMNAKKLYPQLFTPVRKMKYVESYGGRKIYLEELRKKGVFCFTGIKRGCSRYYTETIEAMRRLIDVD